MKLSALDRCLVCNADFFGSPRYHEEDHAWTGRIQALAVALLPLMIFAAMALTHRGILPANHRALDSWPLWLLVGAPTGMAYVLSLLLPKTRRHYCQRCGWQEGD